MLDELRLLVVVDNETDTLSSVDDGVPQAPEMAHLLQHGPRHTDAAGRTCVATFEHLCLACHGFSVLATGRRGDTEHTMLFDTGPDPEAGARSRTIRFAVARSRSDRPPGQALPAMTRQEMTRQESLLALNNFLFLAVIKLLIFAGGLLPLAIVLGGPSAGGLPAAATILAALAAPFLIALEVGVVCRLLPKPVPGRHPFFSKHYYRTLRLQEIHEVVANTTFLNNLVHRVEPLRLCVHRLLGLRKRGFIIVAPDVRLLDPYMIRLGARVFIGMECNISAHIVVGPSMWIQPVEIGDRALIGAACQISCATAIGDDVKLDYGVLVSHGCTIGRESVVLRTTFLASGVRIGERVTIGAGCRIGKDAVIGDSARIGDFAVITGGAKIAPGARVPDAAVVGGGMEARDLATGSG